MSTSTGKELVRLVRRCELDPKNPLDTVQIETYLRNSQQAINTHGQKLPERVQGIEELLTSGQQLSRRDCLELKIEIRRTTGDVQRHILNTIRNRSRLNRLINHPHLGNPYIKIEL